MGSRANGRAEDRDRLRPVWPQGTQHGGGVSSQAGIGTVPNTGPISYANLAPGYQSENKQQNHLGTGLPVVKLASAGPVPVEHLTAWLGVMEIEC